MVSAEVASDAMGNPIRSLARREGARRLRRLRRRELPAVGAVGLAPGKGEDERIITAATEVYRESGAGRAALGDVAKLNGEGRWREDRIAAVVPLRIRQSGWLASMGSLTTSRA